MAASRRQLVFSRPGCQLRLKAFLVRQGKEDHWQSRPAFWLVISHTRDQRRSARTGSVRISFGQRSNEQTTGPSSFFHSRRKGLRRALRSPSLRPSIYRASQKPWIKLLAPWFRRGRMFPHGLAPRQGRTQPIGRSRRNCLPPFPSLVSLATPEHVSKVSLKVPPVTRTERRCGNERDGREAAKQPYRYFRPSCPFVVPACVMHSCFVHGISFAACLGACCIQGNLSRIDGDRPTRWFAVAVAVTAVVSPPSVRHLRPEISRPDCSRTGRRPC